MKTHLTDVDLIKSSLPASENNSAKGDDFGTKQCTLCNMQKCLSDFHSKGSRLDSACKACTLIKKKKMNMKLANKKRNKKLASNKVINISDFFIIERLSSNKIDASDFKNILSDFVIETEGLYRQNKR